MANADTAQVGVTVAYGIGPREVDLTRLQLPVGSTLGDAITASGVLQRQNLTLDELVVGLWGKTRPPETVLRENDRVELWRGLRVDPKEARRQRYRKAPKPSAP